MACIAKKIQNRERRKRREERETGSQSSSFLCPRAAACAFASEFAKFRFEEEGSPSLLSHLACGCIGIRDWLCSKQPRLFYAGMSSTSSSQSPTSPGRESTSANDNARPHDPGTDSAGPARSRLSLQLDQRSLHFSVNAWVLIVALIGILPVASRQLQYKGYRLSLLGTTCTTGYALLAFYGLPRAGSTQAVQVWCHHVTSSKDFIPFMYCLMFVTSKLHLKLVLVPVICWALEHVSRFLRRHFTNSSLYRAYLEQLCTWVETNINAVNFLTANAEILLGFLLILSLFSRQRNVMQTFMYWQLLKLMYHSPFTAGYHRAIWLKIGRTVNPYIHRYTPFLHDPINAGMRWWFR